MAGVKDKWWEDERETAELIWCAAHLHRIIAPLSLKGFERAEDLRLSDGGSPAEKSLEDSRKPKPLTDEETEPRTPIATYPKNFDHPPASPKKTESPSSDRASPIPIPDPFPLPKPASISKMLLPLAKRVSGILVNELDVDATVEQTSEANGLLMMAFRPPLERWFEVHLLIDSSPSMAFWGDLVEGVATLFRWQGFFRDVRVWQFETLNSEPRLFSGAERIEREIRSLIAPGRNRLFVALTDTLGKAWHSGTAFAALAILGEQHPVTIAHVFPQSLWRRTALDKAIQRPLIAPHSGCPNSMLKVGARLHTTDGLYRFPIFNLSPNHFKTWANFLAGSGGNSIQGVLIRQEAPGVTNIDDEPESVEETSEHLLRGFLTDASPEARELAKILAAVPLIPPVMRLAQRQFLPDSEHWHLAEVFFSGLLQKSSFGPTEATVPETWYDFRSGIRELLLGNSPVLRTAEIWREIGDFIHHHYGSLRDFQALIPNPEGSIQDTAVDRDSYFAEVDAAVLMTWGGEYTIRAQELRNKVAARKQQIESLPPIKSFEFKVALIEVNQPSQIGTSSLLEIVNEAIFAKTEKYLNDVEQLVIQGVLANQTYEEIAASAGEFAEHLPVTTRTNLGSYLRNNVAPNLWKVLSTVFGEKVTKRNAKKVIEEFAMPKIAINTTQKTAPYYIEDLGNEIRLEMVLIPGGSFMMGSPEDELERRESESPQHLVNINPFCIGKYPVTQEQWRAVASLPQVHRTLDSEPSRFTGDKRPVEQVSWDDAVEFCDRLTSYTKRQYRLPSEAEWEYACRAGTTTPFHFGETITTDLANYDGTDDKEHKWSGSYGPGPKGTYQQETTDVGSFGVANAFGLYDMHGNVWEWCADHWHDNYEGATTDGSAWIDIDNDNDNHFRLLRGGSWNNDPEYCRCASRFDNNLGSNNVGFRVVCAGAVARTF